jgi:hypothetical protein
MQASYPMVIDELKRLLLSIRQTGAALDVHQIHGVIVAQIQYNHPEIFKTVVKRDGSTFSVSTKWVRKFLAHEMNWTLRWATCASQKTPADADYQLHTSLLHQAYSVRRYAIPSNLQVNSDQTQVIYQQSSTSTYERKGSRQVSTVGLEEKRAFTLNVAISASGALLPFQIIFKGKTKASLPTASSFHYDEAIDLGFSFEISGTDNYWANMKTMKSFALPHTSILRRSICCLIHFKSVFGNLISGQSTRLSSFELGCSITIPGSSSIMFLEDAQVFGNPAMLVSNACSSLR